MKYAVLVAMCLLTLLAVSLVQSQTEPGVTTFTPGTPTAAPVVFSVAGEIGRALPRKFVYDAARDQMAIVDAYNRLLLIDAADYSTRAVLHDRGDYADIEFSGDGRWLAVLYGLTVELWATETGQLAASLTREIGAANRLEGPFDFSSDDNVLLFYGIYPAPLALRRSENDTIRYPWVWHLPAARGEAPSTFPNGAVAVQMFDYPNGFVLTPDDKIVAALPSRLQILDAFSLQPEYEIPTERYERDPVQIWRSLRDQRVYVRPTVTNALWQVDTTRRSLIEIPMNADLTQSDLSLGGIPQISSAGTLIGDVASRQTLPLLRVFLGDYRDSTRYGYRPLTITLIDLLTPPANTRENVLALLFVYDERQQAGQFMITAGLAEQIALKPDNSELLVRLAADDGAAATYDLRTGQETRRVIPALRSLGAYNRLAKNRVLAYDRAGQIIISDFQRLNADSLAVIAEDLRYSRVFDRYFFSQDSQKLITLAGTEWREWDIATGTVLRREVVNLGGTIVATSADGYRFLTEDMTIAGGAVVSVTDMNDSSQYSITIAPVPGSSVAELYPNPSWTRVLAVYATNSYGPYYPGNQVGLYDRDDGFRWLIAGDDLPPADARQYNWLNDDTVVVVGQGPASGQPARIFGVDYAPSGLPACIATRFPERTGEFLRLWERLLYFVRADRLHELSLRICAQVPQTADEVEAMLQLTATPAWAAQISDASGLVPQCLIDRYPADADAYTSLWLELTIQLPADEAQALAEMLCEDIGPIPPTQAFDPTLGTTMFIDAETGVRSIGDYQQPVRDEPPMQEIYRLFEESQGRALGNAILSPDRQLLAASNLPGELVVYRMETPFEMVMAQVTATASAALAEANLIYAQPTPSPVAEVVGTPRPTLTPTPEQTLYPRPQENAYAQSPVSQNLCPSDTLYEISSPPPGYAASGQLIATFSDGPLWVVEPENGQRREAPEVIQCTRGVNCQLSPDNRWILAETYDLVYVARPDNSDQRLLWDLRTPNPPTPIPQNLYWAGPGVLEWEASIPVLQPDGTPVSRFGYVRDAINVFPDPPPWAPDIEINGIPATFVSRQPNGPWAVAYTTYNTGTGSGRKYFLYQTETSQYAPFAQSANNISVQWHPAGDRLYFQIDVAFGTSPTYQIVFPELRAQVVGDAPAGVWSNDGRYRIYRTSSRAYPLAVQNRDSGETRAFCLPETGARLYDGPFMWSPDNRYVALQAPLPADEAQEGVGQHTLILDTETGAVVDLTTGMLNLVLWAQEPGTYGDTASVTATPAFFPIVTATSAP